MFYELDHDGFDNSTESQMFAGNLSEPLTPELRRNIAALKAFDGFDKMSVRVIVHGFGAACRHVWIYEMRTALMAVVSGSDLVGKKIRRFWFVIVSRKFIEHSRCLA